MAETKEEEEDLVTIRVPAEKNSREGDNLNFIWT